MDRGPTWTWNCLPLGDEPVESDTSISFGGLDAGSDYRLRPVVDGDG